VACCQVTVPFLLGLLFPAELAAGRLPHWLQILRAPYVSIPLTNTAAFCDVTLPSLWTITFLSLIVGLATPLARQKVHLQFYIASKLIS